MKKSNIFILLIMLYAGLFFTSCDETTAPHNVLEDAPSIRNLALNPNAVEFDKDQDGFNDDTTLVISISAETANNSQGYIPYFSVTNNNGELFTEDDLTPAEPEGGIYNAEIHINTSTTSFEQYLVNVMISDESGKGNYAQSTLRIVGIPNDPPVILEAENPENVVIPSEGETVIRFTAKVTDPDGQDNIDRVLIEFINEDGSTLVPDPNILLDDGDDSSPGGSGDLVAGDSVYTRAFSVNSSNSPNRRTVQYFAIDRAGLSSDTVETQFNIVE